MILTLLYNFIIFTAWKVSIFGGFLVCSYPHSDWIRRDTAYLSVFSPNAGKYRPEKLRMRTFFIHWLNHLCSWLDDHLPMIDKLERTNKSVLMPMITVKTPPPPVATPFSKSFLKKNTLAVLPGCCLFLDAYLTLLFIFSFVFFGKLGNISRKTFVLFY